MTTKTVHLIVWSSILAATFLLSLILFLAAPGRKDRFVLFFPSETTAEWIGEGRNIAHMRQPEDSIHEILKELALGPTRLRLEPAVPKSTKVRSVVLRETVLYVDFSEHLAVPEVPGGPTLTETLAGVEKTVLFNYPVIEDVVFLIRGYPAE